MQLKQYIDGDTVMIYRGSLHGYSAKSFHDKVDNQGPTLCIVKSDSQ